MHKSNKTLNYIVKKECAVNYWLRILNLVEFDLNIFFTSIIQHEFSNFNEQIHLEIEDGLFIFFDESQLIQVLHNLIRNALRHNAKEATYIIVKAYQQQKNILEVYKIMANENANQDIEFDDFEDLDFEVLDFKQMEDTISKAIEENLHHINPPVQGVFETFLVETKYISSSIPDALLRLSTRINNTIFEEWCLELIACQDNRNLKHTLPKTVFPQTLWNL